MNASQFSQISQDVFSDIFEAMEVHEIQVVAEKIEKYFKKWTSNMEVKAVESPILIYDFSNLNENFYCDSWELLRDVDIIS